MLCKNNQVNKFLNKDCTKSTRDRKKNCLRWNFLETVTAFAARKMM